MGGASVGIYGVPIRVEAICTQVRNLMSLDAKFLYLIYNPVSFDYKLLELDYLEPRYEIARCRGNLSLPKLSCKRNV